MKDRLVNPANGQDAVTCKMNGAVKIDFVEFGDYRTRAIPGGTLYYEYKHNGVWYVLSETSLAIAEEEFQEAVDDGDVYRSPVQE